MAKMVKSGSNQFELVKCGSKKTLHILKIEFTASS